MIGNGIGMNTRALITRMDEPIGKNVGNAHEILECIQIMRNEQLPHTAQTLDIVKILVGSLLQQVGVCANDEEANRLMDEKIKDGSALKKFRRMVEMHGGDPTVCEDPVNVMKINEAVITEIKCGKSGVITKINGYKVAKNLIEIGGGRKIPGAKIDPIVGVEFVSKEGDRVEADTI